MLLGWLFGYGGGPTEPPPPLPEPLWDKAQFVVDTFYRVHCPEHRSRSAGICAAVAAKHLTLEQAIDRLCKKYAANSADWCGDNATALVKYRLERFYLTYDPASLDKVPGLVEHVRSERFSLDEILGRMIEKYSGQGAKVASWSGEYPLALRGPEPDAAPGPLASPKQSSQRYQPGDTITGVIDGRVLQGTVEKWEGNALTVTFEMPLQVT
eukprot:Hpha_TRINITY_DN35152_c0_g1::TRINITY_DN35152_c0_g1_i1::g.168416::m.168416